jgi:uncharacterized glyoxalase superfamily protein PhnB
VSCFTLAGGLRLATWAQDDIARDAGWPISPVSPTSFTIGHNVATREDVDEVMAQAARAGAMIVKPAQETFYGGYAGYFQEPNVHIWEGVWNPDSLAIDSPG